jgi:hypothetical protein
MVDIGECLYRVGPRQITILLPFKGLSKEVCRVYFVLTCGYVIGASLLSFSFSIVSLSSLRSSFVPTRIIGTLLQWCLTSGYHLALTFSKEAGFTSEKHIRKTSYNLLIRLKV